MGTKSHISKALPASIMTKGIGLIALQQTTFRTGCVYLNFPGHFLYVLQQQNTADGKFLRWESDAEEIWRFFSALAFCFILLCFIWKPRSLNLVFMFGEKSICNGCARALFSPDCMPRGSFPFLTLSPSFSLLLSPSLSQNICGRESRSLAASLWAFASIFHTHYETPLIKLQVYATTRPPSICNKCLLFFSSVFSFSVCVSAFSGGCRLDESDFMPVSKPKVFYL